MKQFVALGHLAHLEQVHLEDADADGDGDADAADKADKPEDVDQPIGGGDQTGTAPRTGTMETEAELRDTMAVAEARLYLEHEFLDNAYDFDWEQVKTKLTDTPDLINVQPEGRCTALHQAAFAGNTDMCHFLTSKGADIAAQNRHGQKPADVAKNVAATKAVFEAVQERERRSMATAAADRRIEAARATAGSLVAAMRGDGVSSLLCPHILEEMNGPATGNRLND